MDLLVKTVMEFCQAHGKDKTYWIGLSGGLDSLVMLHLFAGVRASYPITVRAIHINHGVSPNASSWADYCAQICQRFAVDLRVHPIHINKEEGNFEESARNARYAIFSDLLEIGDVMLTGHHQDDQAETILLQLIRGAGPKGLAAMPFQKAFGKGILARPLLPFSRQELQTYAVENDLTWIDDESNANCHFSRNFIRHEVLPLLKTRWPGVIKTLARSAEHCAETQQLSEELIKQDLILCQGSKLNTLSIAKMSLLDPLTQRHMIRNWLVALNFPIPPTVKLQQIQKDMLNARSDKSPHFFWRDVELRRYRDDLFVMKRLIPHESKLVYQWKLKDSLSLPNIGILQATLTRNQGLRSDIQQVSVCFRQGGEKIRLSGRKTHHSLKNLFQEWGIPPWERDRVPLIYVEDKLVAVVGYFVSEDFRVKEGEGYLFNIIPLC